MPISETYLIDNMEYMAGLPDKFFDLAVVDPPYGIDINMNMGRRKGQKKKHTEKGWDRGTPGDAFFKELFRVSRNQIIWGGNYFDLPLTGGWLFWDKQNPEGVSFSDGELAWTSFLRVLKKVRIPHAGFITSDPIKIHPTQKPPKLYSFCFSNYAKPGQKIFDSHLGSQSSRVAAWDLGLDFYGCEIDPEYFEQGNARFEAHKSKPPLFSPDQMYNFEQTKLFE